MICGKSLKTGLLGLGLLLLLSLPSWSQEAVFEITESELTALENNLAELRTTNAELRNNLSRVRSALAESQNEQMMLFRELTEAQNSLNEAERSLTTAQTYFDEYERGVQKSLIQVGAVSISVGVLAGLAVGGLLF